MTIQSGALDKLLGNVAVSVSVELGRAEMKLKDVLALREESVVALDRLTDELLDVMVNGRPIAKAEVMAQDGRFALRIVELIRDEDAGPAAATPPTAPIADIPPAESA